MRCRAAAADSPDAGRRVDAHLADRAEEALVERLSRLQYGISPHDVWEEAEVLRRAGPHWNTQVAEVKKRRKPKFRLFGRWPTLRLKNSSSGHNSEPLFSRFCFNLNFKNHILIFFFFKCPDWSLKIPAKHSGIWAARVLYNTAGQWAAFSLTTQVRGLGHPDRTWTAL